MGETKTYYQKNITFILEPQKIIVRTNLQSFYLEPVAHYWNRRINLIRRMVEIGEVRSLNELAEWGGPGVMWTTTHYYPVDKQKQVAYN